jgi:hypothetical protein
MMFLAREDLIEWLPRQMTAPLRELAVADEDGTYVSVTVTQTDGVQVRSGLDVYGADVDLQALASVLLSELVTGYALLAMRRPMKLGEPK